VKSDRELQAYFSEAAVWDADRLARLQRNARLAWRVASAGWIAVTANALALAFLTPLKTVEPYVIRVDSSSGIADVVPVYEGSADIAETVTRFLLTHYIQTCERFNYGSAEQDYFECGAYHTARLNQQWSQQWAPINPMSPLNLYKDGTVIRVQVKSVTFLKRTSGVSDMAQIRYSKATIKGGSGVERRSEWIATIQYTYSKPSADPGTRQRNPLGLKIVEVQRESEVAAPSAMSVSAPEPMDSTGAIARPRGLGR
jgi:type IV secretion system protein VirB8